MCACVCVCGVCPHPGLSFHLSGDPLMFFSLKKIVINLKMPGSLYINKYSIDRRNVTMITSS